jgi:hypothetical protein
MRNLFSAALLLFLLTACNNGPPQGTVSGTVTLNGEPADGNALIRMVPVDGNSQPNDCVLKQGRYELTMTPGEVKVELRWMKGGATVADTANQGNEPQAVQQFPKRYNDETELRYTVTAGKQTKDFAITLP